MFKGHPKGLLASALANMGERYGFYTMMAILVLFLQAKFGLDETNAGLIYSVFYFSIYILAFVGGIIADKTRNYKGTIMVGQILMAVGYLLIAIPTATPVANVPVSLAITCFGLFVIAFGNGLFKGNLQALVGQMYDNPVYSKLRDSGFSWFYMFINVGAIFAPFTAIGIRSWWLGTRGFTYNAALPELCHSQIGGTINAEGTAKLTNLATEMGAQNATDLTLFAKNYLNVFTEGFHYAFGVAIFAVLISLVIYLVNKKYFPDPKKIGEKSAAQESGDITMDIKEIKQRIYALLAVMGVVIFFWFSFHQNGLTLTYFAKDYTLLKIGSWEISAEIFQSMNPFFVVFLTPIVIAIYGWLRSKGMEPSTPRKIVIGMGIAASAYILMTVVSYVSNLPLLSDVKAMGGLAEVDKVTPFLLIGTYFILTVAELFISPLGLSFVSKVAPPQYQGVMQGAWLGATAVGNLLLFIGAIFYQNLPIWLTWTLFVSVCFISMMIMLSMVKWLERIAK